jgi:hypothetical protein
MSSWKQGISPEQAPGMLALTSLRCAVPSMDGRVEASMTTLGHIPNDAMYRHVAAHLAAAHRRADPNLVKVYLALDSAQREVRLVEVTTAAPTTMEALPFRFAPTADVPLPSAVLLLSPDEWAARERRELDMPDGWERLEEL